MGVIFLMLSAVRRYRKLKLLDLTRRGSEVGAEEDVLLEEAEALVVTTPRHRERQEQQQRVEQMPLGEVEKGQRQQTAEEVEPSSGKRKT